MRPKNKHNENEENFWISATDMMAGILTVVLLLLMLFILYLNLSKSAQYTGRENAEASYNETASNDYAYRPIDNDEDDKNHDYDDHANGGGEDRTEPTQETMPPADSGNEDGRDKSAVFVTVVDADTGNTIKKSGTEFELYADKNGIGGLQTLHTYYPKKIEYKKYTTTAHGTFYLPEKITNGWYSLHNVKPPKGYYMEKNTDFEIKEYWDWPEPFMVKVKMTPIKSVIRVQVNDGDTAKPVQNVVYKVIAAEDIVAVDGTVRYRRGEQVDEITTNRKGYAKTKRLYIGNYILKQTEAPEYYAVNVKNVSASIYEDMEKNTDVVGIKCDKTEFTVRLIDERTKKPVEGAVYIMEGRDDLVTDENGEFTISDLEKEVKYTLNASSVPEGYLKKNTQTEFTVDGSGLINKKASYVYTDTAYTLSLSVGINDLVFGRSSTGIDLVLSDKNGNIIDEWTSGDDEHIVSGLEKGVYYVRRLGENDNLASVNLEDTAELQDVNVRIWDTVDLFAVLIGSGVIILAVIAVGMLIRRKRAGKKRG